ncbi:hypothetical protein [Acinetobacter phage ABPH49]|nr:hypothetical protein [Acinetobacter phage ABPH49]
MSTTKVPAWMIKTASSTGELQQDLDKLHLLTGVIHLEDYCDVSGVIPGDDGLRQAIKASSDTGRTISAPSGGKVTLRTSNFIF